MKRRSIIILLFVFFGVFLVSASSYAQFDNTFLAPDSGLNPREAVVLRRLITIGIGAVIGVFSGLFLSPGASGFRRLLMFLVIGAGCIYAIVSPTPLAEVVTLAVAWGAFFLFFSIGIRFGWIKPRKLSPVPATSFGTAKWATLDLLKENRAIGGNGFALGGFAAGNRLHELVYNGDRHLLTVAPTRSGKGVTAIIPNLLSYEGSALVIDPKGENAMITAQRRGKGNAAARTPGLGQRVFIVDPWGIAAPKVGMTPARINPLDWIKLDDPDLAENAFLLVDSVIPSEARGEESFWDDESKGLLIGIMIYVATATEEAGNRHFGRVRDIITLGGKAFDAVLEKMYEHPNPIVSSTAARTAAKEPKLRANVMASLQAHTHFLDSPRIRESLSVSDFSFADLKSFDTTIYLVLPADRLKTFDRWLRLLVQQAISINARSIEDKPSKPILFMLDEMAALGRLAMVEQAYGLMAGFGMQLWGIVQDLSQLKRIYGDGFETFISNSGVIQYFGSRDRMTADYFSTLCGVTTIRILNVSQAIGETIGRFISSSQSRDSNSYSFGDNSGSSNTITASSNESQRKLAYPDELMVLRSDLQLVFMESLDPIIAQKIKWFENEKIAQLGLNIHKRTSHPSRSNKFTSDYKTEISAVDKLHETIADKRRSSFFENHPDDSKPLPAVPWHERIIEGVRSFVERNPLQSLAAAGFYFSVPYLIGFVPWLLLSLLGAFVVAIRLLK